MTGRRLKTLAARMPVEVYEEFAKWCEERKFVTVSECLRWIIMRIVEGGRREHTAGTTA